MRDADWVGDYEKRAAKPANNLIMSRSSLIFQANNYHMQRHILSKIKTREQILPIVHWLLLCNYEAILLRGKEKILPLPLSSLQHYPTKSSQCLFPLFVALLSNRANELRGRRWERGIEWKRGKKNNSVFYYKTKRGGAFLKAVGEWGCRIDANRMCRYWPENQINRLFCLLQPSASHHSRYLLIPPFSHTRSHKGSSTSDNSAATPKPLYQSCFSYKTCPCPSSKNSVLWNWYKWGPDAVNTFSVTSCFL